MADTNEEISQKVRDGSYYSDARDWYYRHYLYPVTERTFLVAITIVLALIFLLSVQNIHSLIGENPKIPFPVKTANATNYFLLMRPLSENNEGTQESIAKYLIEDYLKSREEYTYNDAKGEGLKYKLKKIKSSSSKSVLDEYKSYMSESNPYSPIVRFGSRVERSIEIQSFKFVGSDKASGKAEITFKAIEKDSSKNTPEESLWEVTVHFRLPDIETIARTGAPLRFLVKYYKAIPVS